ncbi:MAG TPA: MXAN_5187 C-terminal domain-containing protein [Terriglobales bacterium]|nr:MXAN_5187 C-terminal domain-containing protein [Terriglobales bacterium]
MATIDEDLGQLERDIRQLKIEYDQYFGGGRKRPPTEIEWRIELIIKRYGERIGDLKFAQRFRYNNLTQSYAKYKDVFRKRMQRKEEGTVERHYGAAARAIEAERAKKQSETAGASASAEQSGGAAIAAAAGGAFRMTCSEPEKESEKVEQLYQAFVNAKLQAGEDVQKLTPASFNEFVKKKTHDLQKQKKCKDVEYVVETVDGQVKLKALVKS